jgi:hypothetical protein
MDLNNAQNSKVQKKKKEEQKQQNELLTEDDQIPFTIKDTFKDSLQKIELMNEINYFNSKIIFGEVIRRI